ncbi:MAG: translation initiation factor 1 [Thermoproteota archaeon]|jgi:translation initiation factor 1
MNDDDYVLVYTDNGKDKKDLRKANKKSKNSSEEVIPANIEIHLRLEKKGRGGKSVCVLYNFPNNPLHFKRLMKTLKKHCGVGGAYKEEAGKEQVIEIQGDKRAEIESFLEALGYKIKFTGG